MNICVLLMSYYILSPGVVLYSVHNVATYQEQLFVCTPVSLPWPQSKFLHSFFVRRV